MDNLTKYRLGETNSDIPIKSAEIQAITHQSILGVGNSVFEKNNEVLSGKFNATLQKQQSKLMKQLQDEKDLALENVRNEHKQHLEKIQDEYAEMMDKALKEEAERLKAIMDKIAMTSLEDEKLEGQRKLDESLKKARIDFDTEKAEALLEVTLEHERVQKQKEKELKAEHEAHCESLNADWTEKLRALSEQAVIHEQETLQNELDMAKKRFDKHMASTLQEADQKHQEVIDSLKTSIEKEKEHGVSLQFKIAELETTIETQKVELKHLLKTFQEFVDRTPGFSPGQSDFVLDQLLPSGFDEFISGSD